MADGSLPGASAQGRAFGAPPRGERCALVLDQTLPAGTLDATRLKPDRSAARP
jgi:hypothetical protein